MKRLKSCGGRVILWSVLGCLPLVLVPLLVGCGAPKPPGATVHLAGQVLLAGKPIPPEAEATVRFMPTRPGQAPPTSVEIVQGKYDAPHVPRGPVTVIFNINRFTGRKVVEDNAPGGTPYDEREDLVPPRSRVGVPLDAQQDDLQHEFDLQ